MAGSGTPDTPQWRKSTFSGEGNCVEIAELADGRLGLRNGAAGDAVLTFTRDDIRAFVLGVKAGEFDDLA